MPCPGEGPCEAWDLDLTCLNDAGGVVDPCLGDGTPVPQEILDSMILAASQFMWAATGRQFGTCTVTLRPMCIDECQAECVDSGYGFPWVPVHRADGAWVNLTCAQPNCTCEQLCEVPLPYPVCSVDEVLINGEIIPDTEYSVVNFNKLIRSKADGCWPNCNNISLPTSEPGTWSITVTYGKPIPELVRLAAAEFACQLVKKALGRPCDLPQRIQSINRQGMSATFLDPMEFMQQGMTGIFLVDLAIKTYNPHRLYKKPTVVSPDSINRWSIVTEE